jgi:uncharacterized protein YbjT (DUF2867 family)
VTILVAGGTGTLGSRVVERLLARGLAVRVLTRDAARIRARPDAHLEVAEGDVRDPASLVAAMLGVETVISAVQGFVGSGGVTPASVDRDGNAHLIDAARVAGAGFVLMSVVGAAPDHPMELCRMKYAAEERLRASGVAWTIVRATAFLETWIALLERTANGSGRPVVFGRGDNPINFVSVDDVAALIDRVVVDPSTRDKVLQIGGPENLTLNELAAAVQRAARRAGTPRHVPQTVLRMMTVLLRPFRPELARQAHAALVFDRADLALDAGRLSQSDMDPPHTTLSRVLNLPLAP